MNLNAFSNTSILLSGSMIAITGSTRGDIESVQSCWLWLLLACTLVVAVGVIIEEAVERLSDERTQWVVEPGWHHSLARIGWTLVIVGVLGEGMFEAEISFADRTLQEFNNTLLAITTDQAHSAAASAKTAREEAEAAKVAAEKAQEKLDAVSKRAEGIDTGLTMVDWLISARRIRDVDGLTADLKREFKRRHIVITSYAGLTSDESFWLCSQLVKIAETADVDPQNECAEEPIRGVPVADLAILGPNHDESQKLAMILMQQPGRIIGHFVTTSEGPVLTILVGVRESIPIWPPKRLGVPASKNSKSKSGKP